MTKSEIQLDEKALEAAKKAFCEQEDRHIFITDAIPYVIEAYLESIDLKETRASIVFEKRDGPYYTYWTHWKKEDER